MKNILILIIALITVTSVTGQVDKATVKVDGLGCPFCAYGLEKKFKEIKGVKKIKIEMETGVMTFQIPTNKKLSMEAIDKQVTKAGYTAVDIKIERADGTIETSADTKTKTVDKATEMVKASLKVKGNCGMCKARIEKAAKAVEGVATATWDEDTKILKVTYNKNRVSTDYIEKAVVKVGHDTGKFKTSKETYNNLPACCMYER